MMCAKLRNQNIDESEFPSLTDSFRPKEKQAQHNGKKTAAIREELHVSDSTQMCISVFKDFDCLHKKECRLAHSLDELLTLNFKHQEIKVDDTKVDEPKSFVCDRQTNYKCAAAFKATLKPFKCEFENPVPTPFRDTIVIRVPKELAMQAFELAMNRGNRCVRVEIIG